MRKVFFLLLSFLIIILSTACKASVTDNTDPVGAVTVPSATLPALSGETLESGLSFSKDPGFYDGEFSLSISCEDDVTVYYTLDGSSPLSSDSVYIYDDGITMRDRSGDPGVVSAVDTALFDAANVTVNSSWDGFDVFSENPSASAVDKCNTVRAVGIDSNGNRTEVLTGTFFIGSPSEHVTGIADSCEASLEAGMSSTLAIISITGDYDDFFSYDKGIYVKGAAYDKALASFLKSGEWLSPDTSRRLAANYNQKGRDWEREVHIEMFEADATSSELAISQDCGIRIQGNYSRSDLQKGFRLYARSDYGKKNFKYPIFGDAVKDTQGNTINKFKSIVLRNGGNCAFTTKYSADYWAYLCEGTEVSTLASRPAVVYLNGEYWGLYVLEENYSQDYFADRYGVDKDSVVLYKGDAEALELGYKLDLGDLPSPLAPEQLFIYPLLTFFKDHDSLADDADYEEFCKLVGPDSVRDYFAVEVWINNKWDWPGKNWSMWRVSNKDGSIPESDGSNIYADGRWRFCFYDLEFGGVSGSGDARINTIKEDNYKTYGLLDMDTTNPAVLCFAYCMTNEGFREDFYARLRELSVADFEKEKALDVLDAFGDIYTPLYTDFFRRYPNTGSASNSNEGGYASKKCIADFLALRAEHIETMIDWCESVVK